MICGKKRSVGALLLLVFTGAITASCSNKNSNADSVLFEGGQIYCDGWRSNSFISSDYILKTIGDERMVVIPVNKETAVVFRGFHCTMIGGKNEHKD